MGIYRFFHSTALSLNISKSALGVLRKKTGYGLNHCRKALELHDNDVTKAEEWLKEQAKALGWSHVTKVQNRQAIQGLVGIAVNKKKISMVEVNCETDFVSRNEKFRSLVELVATTCLQVPVLSPGLHTNKVLLDSEKIGILKANDMSLADHLALIIGSVGENMILKRALCYETNRNDIDVAALIHPPENTSDVLLGKYGTFISYQKNPETPLKDDLEFKNAVNDLCQHIIGMNPIKIGDFNEDKPIEEKSEEKVLIHQEFLMDSSITAGEFLTESGITLVDFNRFACGESEIRENQSAPEEDVVEKGATTANG